MRKSIFLILLLLPLAVSAKIELPAILGDNMVLQRNAQVNLWGKATPDQKVSVTTSWNGAEYQTTAGRDGAWKLQVATTEAGGPYSITISDGTETVLNNVLLGEVWICGGQSNMEMPVGGFAQQPVFNSADHILRAGELPGIRLFTVQRASTDTPQSDCKGSWLLSDPQSVRNFSAVGYFFGKALAQTLDIPVGLISSNWGGSAIETWMTTEAIDATPGIDHKLAKSREADNQAPQLLYNGMILPIRNFTAKGFIWYQGEANRSNAADYKNLMVSMVKLWREVWGNPDMPFYYVQLAPYNYNGADLRSMAVVVESQYGAMQEIPHSGIAATTDIGNATCIHPSQKEKVGTRLAYLALQNDYGVKGLPAPAPTYRSMEIKGNKAILTFNHVANGGEGSAPDTFSRYLVDGSPCVPGSFEIAGADRKFYPAKARFVKEKNRIEVSSDQVPQPVAVRYAFKNYPADANVMTTLGQPLAPFRTDDWPIEDF